MAYRARTGGVMGSGLYPQANTGVDVAGGVDAIAQALAGRRDGLIRQAMMKREFQRQDAADAQAAQDRDYLRQRQEAADASAAEQTQYERARQARLDDQAEAKQAEETAAKRAELGIVPDRYEPVMDPVSPVSDFQPPTIRSAMMANVGQFGGGAPKTGLSIPATPSVGALPKMQLVAGITDPTLGTKYKEKRQEIADARETHAINRDYDNAHPAPKSASDRAKEGQPSESERRAGALYAVANDAIPILDSAGAPGYWDTLSRRAGGQALVSTHQQVVNQAALQLSAAYLYTVSGATASPEEVEKTAQTFVPQVGDSDAVLARKASARKIAVGAIRTMAGRAVPPTEGQQQTPLTAEDRAHAQRDPQYKAWLVSKGYQL